MNPLSQRGLGIPVDIVVNPFMRFLSEVGDHQIGIYLPRLNMKKRAPGSLVVFRGCHPAQLSKG